MYIDNRLEQLCYAEHSNYAVSCIDLIYLYVLLYLLKFWCLWYVICLVWYSNRSGYNFLKFILLHVKDMHLFVILFVKGECLHHEWSNSYLDYSKLSLYLNSMMLLSYLDTKVQPDVMLHISHFIGLWCKCDHKFESVTCSGL